MGGGRRLEFDKQQALEAAMHVFWKKGFAGASLTDLTEEMGINKPSLYATFGNKEALFVQATEHYIAEIATAHVHYLQQSGVPLRERLKNYLMSVVASQCDGQQPKGCYISLCASESAGDGLPPKAQECITTASHYTSNTLLTLFNTDPEARQIGLNLDAESKVLLIVTLLNGTAAMARSGATLKQLEGVVDLAISAISPTPE